MDFICFLCLSLQYCNVFFFCSLAVTYWAMADLLALLYVMSSCLFVTFSYCVLGQVWYLIVSIPDLCLLSYFFLIFIQNSAKHSLCLR